MASRRGGGLCDVFGAVLVVFEAGGEFGQECGQGGAVVGGEAGQQAGFGAEQVGVGLVDQGPAVGGELDVDGAPVAGGGAAGDEAAALEAVEPFGHGGGGDQDAAVQLGGGQPVAGAAAAQRGEHVVFAGVELVAAVDLAQRGGQVTVDAGDAAEDCDGGE